MCNVFGKKKKELNVVRYEIFNNVYKKKDSRFAFAVSMSTIIAFALLATKLHRKSVEVHPSSEH